MARLLRAPLVHFLVLGGALLALRAWFDPAAGPETAGRDLCRRRRAAHGSVDEEHGSPPDAAATEGLVNAAIYEELLYRRA